jgi:hypothetical protein
VPRAEPRPVSLPPALAAMSDEEMMAALNPGMKTKAVEVPSYYKEWPDDAHSYHKQIDALEADLGARKIPQDQAEKRLAELDAYMEKTYGARDHSSGPEMEFGVRATGSAAPIEMKPMLGPTGEMFMKDTTWGNKRKASRLEYEDDFVGPPEPRRELPGDPMERATEQGYRGPFYTGVGNTQTDVPVRGFRDPRSGSKSFEQGIFLTNNPEIATHYSHKGMSMPIMVRAENPTIFDWSGGQYDGLAMERMIKEAIEKGHDTAIMKNMKDMGGLQDQLVVLEPNRLRVPWANFDPTLKDSRNLLSGVAGGAVSAKVLSDWIDEDKAHRL